MPNLEKIRSIRAGRAFMSPTSTRLTGRRCVVCGGPINQGTKVAAGLVGVKISDLTTRTHARCVGGTVAAGPDGQGLLVN